MTDEQKTGIIHSTQTSLAPSDLVPKLDMHVRAGGNQSELSKLLSRDCLFPSKELYVETFHIG